MSDICRNLGDVMQKYYQAELNADTPLLFNDNGVWSVRLDNWPTEISQAPTIEHLNSLIGE